MEEVFEKNKLRKENEEGWAGGGSKEYFFFFIKDKQNEV